MRISYDMLFGHFLLQAVARTAYIQAYESNTFTSNPEADPDAPPQVYSGYLSHVRSQVTATKEIHDLLQDFSASLDKS
jgi:hypothetical protein